MDSLKLIAGTRAKYAVKVPADALAQYSFRAALRSTRSSDPIKVVGEGSGIVRTSTGILLVFDMRTLNLVPGSDYRIDIQVLDDDDEPVMQNAVAVRVVPNFVPV